MHLLLPWNFFFSLNTIAPVGEIAAVSRFKYPSLQGLQLVLWHGTTPSSSSGLHSALVSRRFKFAGCLADKMTLFFYYHFIISTNTNKEQVQVHTATILHNNRMHLKCASQEIKASVRESNLSTLKFLL